VLVRVCGSGRTRNGAFLQQGEAETVEKLENEFRQDRNAGEVVVVGGSAAGFYTATHVARGGRSVRVLESMPTLDPTSRTLIVTDHFKNQMGQSARASILNEIRRFELFTDGRSAVVSLHRPDLIIERSRLIPALAQEAQAAGASIDYDTRFLGLSPNGHGLRVEIDRMGQRKELHAASLVGAEEPSAGWPRPPGGLPWIPSRWCKRS